jgi:UDP-N-acetyl-2-amino-2-deoxyglucuronate dehydrogenase
MWRKERLDVGRAGGGMADRLRIGMIGCGEIAVQTAAAISASRFARHAMAMDTRAELARNLGETHGVPWTDRVEAVLANPEVDAVYVAVPHDLHAPLAIRALEAGKHVLVEKPIATTLADADAMIAAARANRVRLSVNFVAQIDPAFRAARDLVAAGAIGTVIGTHIVYRGNKPASYWTGGFTGRVQTDWRSSKTRAGGGVLIMNAIHDLNTLRFVTGLEVTRVHAEYGTFATPVEVEDYVAATYRYDNGAIGSVEAGSALPGRDPLRDVDRIYGTAGQILFGSPFQIYLSEPVTGLSAGEWQPLPIAPLGPEEQQVAMVDGFSEPILAGRAPAVPAEDGQAALATVLAAYRSGAEGRPVSIREVLST